MVFSIRELSLIVSKLSIFIFILAANFVGDTYSCGLRHLLREYMIVKHIFGFFIMLFFVGLVQEEISLMTKISQTIILYIWFIFIMRAPIIVTLIVIIIISCIYLLNLYIKDLENKSKDLIGDENQKNQTLINNLTKTSNNLFLSSFIISVIGTLLFIYLINKRLKGKLNPIRFLLGSRNQECYDKRIYNKFKNNPLLFDFKRIIEKSKPIHKLND